MPHSGHEAEILSWLRELGDRQISQNDDLKAEDVGLMASKIFIVTEAIVPAAKNYLHRVYSASPNGAVVDGRNMGTDWFPDANFKFYLTADGSERVFRRYVTSSRGSTSYPGLLEREEIQTIANKITERETPFSSNELPPLDTVVINTTGRTAEEVYFKALAQIYYGHDLKTLHTTRNLEIDFRDSDFIPALLMKLVQTSRFEGRPGKIIISNCRQDEKFILSEDDDELHGYRSLEDAVLSADQKGKMLENYPGRISISLTENKPGGEIAEIEFSSAKMLTLLLNQLMASAHLCAVLKDRTEKRQNSLV